MDQSFLSNISALSALRYGSLTSGYRDSAKSRHQLVMSFFPQKFEKDPRASGRVLFRLENIRSEKGYEQRSLIRSAVRPGEIEGLRSIEEDLNSIPQEGDLIGMRFTAAPIRRRKTSEFHIHDPEEQEEWVKERLKGAIKIEEVINSETETVQRFPDKNRQLLINLVQFDAIGTVSDRQLLKEMLANGVGRNKNYGSGLLTIRSLG